MEQLFDKGLLMIAIECYKDIVEGNLGTLLNPDELHDTVIQAFVVFRKY